MFPTALHSFSPEPTPTSLFPRQFDAELPKPSSTCFGVLVALSTGISIPDYHRFYSEPVESFQPDYTPFPDGSLIARPFLNNVTASYGLLLFIGALMMLFLRNVIVSADYIRRGRVRYKTLFYVLLISQVMGFVTFVLAATTYFVDNVNCKLVVVSAGILTEISSALLLSGILGVKAYKCLDDSKWVLAIIGVLQTTSSGLIFADVFRFQTQRTLVGSCSIISELRLVLWGVVTRLLIALFISLCFIYALWKSSKIPAAQGRISIGLSDTNSESFGAQSMSGNGRRPRGWWDYVAESNSRSQQQSQQDRVRATSWVLTEDQGFFKNMALLFRSLWSDGSSVLKRTATSSPRSNSFVPLSGASQISEKASCGHSGHSGPPVTPMQASDRRMSRFTIRMHHFREAMRNELAHTALITIANFIATIIGLIGIVRLSLPDSPEYFIGANWAFLSLLVIHSFGRVVARNEREAQIQHPSAWDPIFKVQEATSSVRESHMQRAWSSISVSSNPRRRTRYASNPDIHVESPHSPAHPPAANNPPENPFEDFEFVQTNNRRGNATDTVYSTTTSVDSRGDPFESEEDIVQSDWRNLFLSPNDVAGTDSRVNGTPRAPPSHNDRRTLGSERDSVSEYSVQQ